MTTAVHQDRTNGEEDGTVIKFDIMNRFSGDVQFTAEIDCLEDASRSYKIGLSVKWAIKSGADLYRADLSGANLYRAILSEANLYGAEGADLVIARSRILPDGDIIGWKKCRDDVIVKLRIPAEAKRSHAFGRKCRAEFADVLEVIGADKAISLHDRATVYASGERIVPDSFDENWQEECSSGIHFFITRAEAEAYA